MQKGSSVKGYALGVLFFTVFLDLLGFGLIIPILPIYAKDLGASGFMIGAIVGGFSLMQFFFASFWGGLSDRYGRRPIMLTSIAVMAIAYGFFSQSTTLMMLLFSRLLSGFGSANISAAQAYISDVTPPEKRAQVFGYMGAAFGAGFIVGPFLGGILQEDFGFEYVGYAAMAFCALNFVSAYFFLPESIKEKNPNSRIIPNPFGDLKSGFSKEIVRQLLVINFVFIVGFSLMQVTASLMWKEIYHLSEKEIGYVFAFIGVSAVVIQGGLIGIINKKLGEKKLLVLGNILMMIGLAAMPWVPEGYFIPLELLCLVVVSFGVAFLTPTINTLISKVISEKEQGKYLGINQSFGSLARFIGPIIGGPMYIVAYQFPYIGSGVLLALTTGLSYYLVTRKL
ncbi:MAG: tetracycline resistance MFS efflux pump [Schleiferiaceae bacterium]